MMKKFILYFIFGCCFQLLQAQNLELAFVDGAGKIKHHIKPGIIVVLKKLNGERWKGRLDILNDSLITINNQPLSADSIYSVRISHPGKDIVGASLVGTGIISGGTSIYLLQQALLTSNSSVCLNNLVYSALTAAYSVVGISIGGVVWAVQDNSKVSERSGKERRFKIVKY